MTSKAITSQEPSEMNDEQFDSILTLENDIHKSKSKSKSNSSANKKFYRFFGSHEQVLNMYSCALLRNKSHLLLQGCLYVTKRSYGFHSNIFGFRTILHGKWSDVTSLKKENIALLFPTAISFVTKNNGKFLLASFLSRNYAYKQLCKVWHVQYPYYDANENGDRSSFSSKDIEYEDKNKMIQNVENNENFQYAAYDSSTASKTSGSSRSHSESFTTNSKISADSNTNEKLSSENPEFSLVDSKEKSSNEENTNVNKNSDIKLLKKQASLTKYRENSSTQLQQDEKFNGKKRFSNETEETLTTLSRNNSILNRILIYLISKNFLVFLIFLTILFTLYIYIFIIFFHVNQIEKKLSDLYNRLI